MLGYTYYTNLAEKMKENMWEVKVFVLKMEIKASQDIAIRLLQDTYTKYMNSWLMMVRSAMDGGKKHF